MIELKFTEINIPTILIIVFVGTMGIISIHMNQNMIATVCASGLVGYLGRGLQMSKGDTESVPPDNCVGEDSA